MTALVDVTTTTTPAATLSLVERIKGYLDTYNQAAADADAEYRREDPDAPPAPVYGIADVVKGVSASDIRNGLGLDGHDAMECIVDEIMREIAGDEYDPWPELTKQELRFLIGERRSSLQCPYRLFTAAWFDEQKPLTFAERVLADRHRAWLEKDSYDKRKRLAKAQAEVAKLTGTAAS